MAPADLSDPTRSRPACHEVPPTSVIQPLRCFLQQLAAAFGRGRLPHAEHRLLPAETTAEAAFAILTRREFTYLSKARANTYRASILGQLAAAANTGRPLRFYYDIGGGYRAGIDRYRRELSFSPGLGELLALRQITLFDQHLRAVYAPGAKFSLVVDNVCALLVNDVPLHRTSSYCTELRALIGALDMETHTDLLVESEHFSPDDYQVGSYPVPVSLPGPNAIENVSRFLGRTCNASEASERIARYAAVSAETEKMLSSIISGVRMTQRATPSTFGFRSFPGGDSRIQSGDVILAFRHHDRIEPRLLTSQSSWAVRVHLVDVSDLLPVPGKQVGYVLANGVDLR